MSIRYAEHSHLYNEDTKLTTFHVEIFCLYWEKFDPKLSEGYINRREMGKHKTVLKASRERHTFKQWFTYS